MRPYLERNPVLAPAQAFGSSGKFSSPWYNLLLSCSCVGWALPHPRRVEMTRESLFLGKPMRQTAANTLAGCARLLHERTILVLLTMFCIGTGCTLWYVSRLQSNLIASIALQDASLYAQALAEFRTLYTAEVVE